MSKKVLVIGSGGREHAICEQFAKSKKVSKIYALPGNAGTAEIARNIDSVALSDHAKIAEFCLTNKIDLVFIGPEQPLVAGIVDDLQKAGIRVFGPSKAASALEGSKAFMKEIAVANSVPTASYQLFNDKASALKFIEEHSDKPWVIKADGLAAGKGVIIANTKIEAESAIEEIFSGKLKEKKIIIEEFLDGIEVSYFVIASGTDFISLGFACDHKKRDDGETGPNTGGMGSFSPTTIIDLSTENHINDKIIRPVLKAMSDAGRPFTGVLFAGLMLLKDGPRLLEFNVRLGDPETQVLLPRITSDFFDLVEAALDGKLDEFEIRFDETKKSVCVVIAANGYPDSYSQSLKIPNLKSALAKLKLDPGKVKILHAGTKLDQNGELVSNGGRVLNIVSSSTSFEDARANAYKLAEAIGFKDGFYRKDIAIHAKSGIEIY